MNSLLGKINQITKITQDGTRIIIGKPIGVHGILQKQSLKAPSHTIVLSRFSHTKKTGEIEWEWFVMELLN